MTETVKSIACWLGGLAAAGLASWLYSDLYACLPRAQKVLLNFAVNRLPENMRASWREQWQADLNDMPPSELWRTIVALDLVRAAIRLRPAAQGGVFAMLRREIRLYSFLWQLYGMRHFFFGALIKRPGGLPKLQLPNFVMTAMWAAVVVRMMWMRLLILLAMPTIVVITLWS